MPLKKQELDINIGKATKLMCIKCKNETNHNILRSVYQEGYELLGETYEVDWHEEHQLVQCKGCDTVSYRSLSGNSEYYDQNGPCIYERLYPDRSESRSPIEDWHNLPIKLRSIYDETITALNNKQAILTGIGIRAIIETVTKDKSASGGNLEKRIDSLVEKKLLTPEGANILHKLRVLGNYAAHEVKAHKPKELALAFDVIDHLLTAVYVLPEHSKRTFS